MYVYPNPNKRRRSAIDQALVPFTISFIKEPPHLGTWGHSIDDYTDAILRHTKISTSCNSRPLQCRTLYGSALLRTKLDRLHWPDAPPSSASVIFTAQATCSLTRESNLQATCGSTQRCRPRSHTRNPPPPTPAKCEKAGKSPLRLGTRVGDHAAAVVDPSQMNPAVKSTTL